jgi:hypothetical protein
MVRLCMVVVSRLASCGRVGMCVSGCRFPRKIANEPRRVSFGVRVGRSRSADVGRRVMAVGVVAALVVGRRAGGLGAGCWRYGV